MSFPEWGAGGGQWVMVRARELSGISVCVVCVFCMWSFPPVAKLPNSWLILFESAEDLLSEFFFPLSKLSIVSSHFQTVFPLLVS